MKTIFQYVFIWYFEYINFQDGQYFALSKFLDNEEQILFTLKLSSLLSPLNDTFFDIVDDEGSFQFSPEVEFTSHL